MLYCRVLCSGELCGAKLLSLPSAHRPAWGDLQPAISTRVQHGHELVQLPPAEGVHAQVSPTSSVYQQKQQRLRYWQNLSYLDDPSRRMCMHVCTILDTNKNILKIIISFGFFDKLVVNYLRRLLIPIVKLVLVLTN